MASITLAARAYQQSFDTHPNRTLAVTGGVLNAFGDFVAQASQNVFGVEEHDRHRGYDFARTARFFCFGVGISPLIGRWNVFLERRFPLRAIGGTGQVSAKALAKRVAADQIVMAPIGLALFLGSMGVMEGGDSKHIKQKYTDLYSTALLTNWKVWPFAQFVNFRYMPLPYRVPFQSTCGIFWTLYLSILNSNEQDKEKHAVEMRRTTNIPK